MAVYGTFKQDVVRGSNLILTPQASQITRVWLFTGTLPGGSISDSGMLFKALETDGLPPLGDGYPRLGYEDWKLKRYQITPVNARQYYIEMTYFWDGALYIRDSSSLSSVTTQLHPKDHRPLIVKWKNPKDANGRQITKILNLNSFLPLRHLTAAQTITYMASGDVLAAFPSVNNAPWKGLPAGYWLFSQLQGETTDEGITYSYSVTLSTKQLEDWSQLGFLQDDRGQAITIPETDVQTLRNKPYEYDIDDSVQGVLKLGLLPMVDFSTLFGF